MFEGSTERERQRDHRFFNKRQIKYFNGPKKIEPVNTSKVNPNMQTESSIPAISECTPRLSRDGKMPENKLQRLSKNGGSKS